MAVFFGTFSLFAQKQELNVSDYGAIGDGKTINTSAIQCTIDLCNRNGGGKVIVPEGIFVSGTLYLKDNVNLYIEACSVLKGSSSFKDYPDNNVKYTNSFSHPPGMKFGNKALIFGEGLRNIAVTGEGVVDGSGDSPEFQLGNDNTPASRNRPSVICLLKCNNVRVEGLRMQNSAYWMQNYIGCDTLTLRNLNIYNHSNYNQDAMDIDASNVLVENCIIDADDDGVCLKSHNADRVVENIVVRNCTIASNCNVVKFGTKSDGGFRNVKISNCIIHKASADHIRHWQANLKFIELPTTVISGFAFEAVDGGIIENIEVSDVAMTDVQTPVFVILGRRNKSQAGDSTFYGGNKPLDKSLKTGYARNLTFRNITATSHSKMAGSITAAAGSYVENVCFENVKISSMGKGTVEEAAINLAEYTGAYPENRMYGQVYPASGFFFRNVKNLSLENVELSVRNEDFRPAIVFDNVFQATVINLKSDAPAGNREAVEWRNTDDNEVVRKE
jgi:polygalacturonase